MAKELPRNWLWLGGGEMGTKYDYICFYLKEGSLGGDKATVGDSSVSISPSGLSEDEATTAL